MVISSFYTPFFYKMHLQHDLNNDRRTGMTLCYILFTAIVLIGVNYWAEDDKSNWFFGFSALLFVVTLAGAGVLSQNNMSVFPIWQHFLASLLAIWGMNPVVERCLTPFRAIAEILDAKRQLAIAKMNAECAEHERQIAKANQEIREFTRSVN